MQWHTEFIVLLARLLKPNLYVELGIRHCETLNVVIPYAKRLIGVDTNPECASHMLYAPNQEFVNLSTLEFAQTLQNEPISIDMLFIDADHEMDSVIADFRAFSPYVVDQGIILFHDTFPDSLKHTNRRLSGTAYQAIEQLARVTDEYEMMTLPIPPGLTVCRKRKAQVAW